MLEAVLEFINTNLVLPITIITFVLLVYIARYLTHEDPNIIKAKIFLKYDKFKNAFVLLAVFGFALIFHVLLIYNPHIFYFILHCTSSFIYQMQRVLGLALVLILMAFVSLIFKSIK